MDSMGKITTSAANLIERMFPWKITLKDVLTIEGRGDEDDTVIETVLLDDAPCSIQAVGSTKTGFIEHEYIILCPWVDTTQVPQPPRNAVNSVELEVTIGVRKYTAKDSQVKGISGLPIYELGGWQIGSRIHVSVPAAWEW